MSEFQYVKISYGVPACAGRLVTVDGKSGIIVADRGHYIGVNFDCEKPGLISHCHPTWRVKYLGMGKARKLTKSQQRGQRWREYGDSFGSFMDFVRWDMSLSNQEGES